MINDEKKQIEQALSIMQSVLDAAIKKGVFENMDASYTAANSFNLIAQKLTQPAEPVVKEN